MITLPKNISKSILALTSAQRLDVFFAVQERLTEQSLKPLPQREEKHPNDIVLDKVSIGYGDTGPLLSGAGIRIKPGSLTIICGPTGGGKTTLVKALLRDIPISDSHHIPILPVAYCAQVPFIITGTFAESILFGDPYDKTALDAAIDAACLREDILQQGATLR